MQDFRIFTEGIADIKFIKDYVDERFKVKLSEDDFDTLGAWSGYKEGGTLKASIQQNHDDNKQCILILDADSNVSERQAEINRDFNKYKIPVTLFLFPNNQLDGNLENMLSEIAVDRKLIECYEGYEKCIDGYHLPVEKAKIYSYLYALLEPKNKEGGKNDLIKYENRNYRNASHWNLHHKFLHPLHKFLEPLFL